MTLTLLRGTDIVLAPAHAGHLGLLRNWIKSGAAEGSFDRELATNSPESNLFFANLRQALVVGYFVQEDLRGQLFTCPTSGYMYYPQATGDRSCSYRLRTLQGAATAGLRTLAYGGGPCVARSRARTCDAFRHARHTRGATRLRRACRSRTAPVARRCSTCWSRSTSPRSETPRICAGLSGPTRPPTLLHVFATRRSYVRTCISSPFIGHRQPPVSPPTTRAAKR